MGAKKKQVRQAFRDSVFNRDGYKCVMCPFKTTKERADEDLDCHHITDRHEIVNGGYVKENGISLCGSCHVKAEKYHISGKTEWEPGFHPDDLYKKIGSSYEKAVQASEKL